MDNKRITEALLLLASSDKHRTQIARLREVFTAMETALTAGVSRVAILDSLHRQGFTMTLRTFDNAVYRIRKRNKKAQVMSAAGSAKVQMRNQESNVQNTDLQSVGNVEIPLFGSHNPDDLTRIMSAPVDLEALSKHSRRKKEP
jgi:hypothetical protein